MSAPDGDRRALRRGLRRGDVEAFDLVFRSDVDRVHRVAARLCADQSMAEDVTAETFLTAWRSRDTIADSDEPLTYWLLAIATRHALNATRGRRRQTRMLSRYAHRAEVEVPDFADQVAAEAAAVEELERTSRALGRLSTRELEVLSLCVWEELSTSEAAVALGIAEGSVRSRLFRARARLRRLVEQEPRGHPAAGAPAADPSIMIPRSCS